MRVPGHLPPENAAPELVDVEEKRRCCLYCAKIPATNHLRLRNTREEGVAGNAILNLPGGGIAAPLFLQCGWHEPDAILSSERSKPIG